jgi:glycosyltransferase involved in cell wall biosynthesis
LIHARRVRRLIESLAPDLVHALHLTSYGFLGALSNVRPLVVSVWGTDILEAPSLTPFHRWLTRYTLERADVLTATGLYLATETTRYAPRSKPVTVVPYGVDLDVFRPAERPASVSPSTSPERGLTLSPEEQGDQKVVVIGTVSRLSPEKGVSYLVEAFAGLRARFGDRVRLRIAGDGPERRRIEALMRQLGIGDAVELRGWVEHEALPAFLNGLDVFVLPSVFEGFGVAAVEAAATGLPVVASNVHGIPDVVRPGETGLLVPAKDVAALGDAIARLVADADLRRAYGEAGRAFVGRHYDWPANARAMELVYKSAVRGRPERTPAWT